MYRLQLFYKIVALKNFAKLTGKPVLELLFNKATGLQVCNFIKKKLQYMCIPVNIAKYLRRL